MSAKVAYLVRTEDGRCRTVVAMSHRGAMRVFLEGYAAGKGEEIEVKMRGGQDDWQTFRVK